jgi:hypothetical protein
VAGVVRRWDGDERGTGIADGGWIGDDLSELVAALAEPNWVAEEPDHHLLPHLQGACEASGSPWTLRHIEVAHAVYVVSLDWTPASASMRQLRADTYALIGTVAESVSYIHQRVDTETVHYDVVTGMLATDTPFRPHGHLIELRIGGPDVAGLCAGARVVPGSTE